MALLIQLRWTAVIGQIVTIGFVDFWLGIALPLAPMAAVIGALVAAQRRQPGLGSPSRRDQQRELLVALMLDVAALTANSI